MDVTTAPTQETIDQFVGNAHGNLDVVKELLEKYPHWSALTPAGPKLPSRLPPRPVRWISSTT